MAAKYQLITELYRRTGVAVAKNPQAWHISKPVREPFHNSLLVSLIHLPYRNRAAAIIALVGVGHIKIVFQRIPATFRVKYGNTLAVLIDPTPKLSVPSFELRNGDSIGALGVY